MLDKLNPELRHFLLMLLVPLLGYFAYEVVPSMDNALVAGGIGVVLAAALAYFTPITRQYGIGSSDSQNSVGE